MTRPDLVGQRFGRLVVVEPAGANNLSKRVWLCRCDCGAETKALTGQLRSGGKASCGCLYRDTRGEGPRTHGKSGTPEHRIWKSMMTRCYNPNRDFWPRYGGRGIKVCQRWRESFAAFLDDMGPRPSPKHSIDRKDNDGDYCPENCRWATGEEQGRNTTKAKPITFDGVTLSRQGWARRLGMSTATITKRMNAGLPLGQVLRRRQTASSPG